jgi:ribosomal protein L17
MLRKFSIVTPLQRPAYKWYQTNLNEITERLEDGIKGAVIEKALMNINITKCSPVSTQSFLEDAVHLTEASARIFLDHILSRSEAYFDSELILVEEDGSAEDAQSSETVKALERRLVALEIAHKTQVKINFANNLVMARIREEIDATSNKSKEDRVVITGLRSKEPMPEENRARIEWLKKITMDLFEKIIPKFSGQDLLFAPKKTDGRLSCFFQWWR